MVVQGQTDETEVRGVQEEMEEKETEEHQDFLASPETEELLVLLEKKVEL